MSRRILFLFIVAIITFELSAQRSSGDLNSAEQKLDEENGSIHALGSGLPPSSLDLQVILEGPYDQVSGLMVDSLRKQGLLPVNLITDPSVLLATGHNALVDYIEIELRNELAPSIVDHTETALLFRNGQIAGLDGVYPLELPVPFGNYHVAVQHRNHFGVMTDAPIPLGASTYTVDFTDPNTLCYGSDPRKSLNGTMVLWSGDVNQDGIIKYTGFQNDRDDVILIIGGTVPTNTVVGYVDEDLNLDGVVKYTGVENDRDIILQNIGGIVPTNTRLEQLP